MNKKRGFRKLIALCLAAVMILTMCVPALAAINDDTKGTITVTGVEGSGKITAYKVIDINFDTTDQQPEEPIYTWDDEVANWINSFDNAKFKSYIDAEKRVTEEFEGLKDNSQDLKVFIDALAAAIRNKSFNITGTEFSWEENSKPTVSVSKGAYILLVEGGVKIYSPGFAQVYPEYDEKTSEWNLAGSTIEVNLKANEPEITKSVSDKSVGVGDTVTYTLEIDVPQYPSAAENAKKTFVFGDKLPAGLLFNNDVKISTMNGTEGDLNQYFALVSNPTDTDTTFEYKVNDFNDFIKKNTGIQKIKVTYTATITADAVADNNKDNLKNTAYLEYNNNPYGTGDSTPKKDDEQVFTYELQIRKVDSKDKTQCLEGAKFNLYKSSADDPIEFILDSDIYRPALNNEPNATTDLVTNSEGQILIKGLDTGEYKLTEIKAPGDYPLPANPDVTITLTDNKTADGEEGIDGDLDSVTAESKGDLIPDEADKNNSRYVTVEDSDKSMAIVTIQNSKHAFHLPVTGGTGTLIFSLIGVAVMGTAVAMVVIARKKRA